MSLFSFFKLESCMRFDSVRYGQGSKCFSLSYSNTNSNTHRLLHVKYIGVWMHFFHDDMAKNTFIMRVFLTLK